MSDLPDSIDSYPDLKGKVAVVTGGAGFLGRHFCLGLSQAGATVVVSDIDYAAAKNVCRKLAEKTKNLLFPAEVDLTDEPSVKKWAGTIRGEFGGVDVLLNNAAAHPEGFFDPLEKFQLEVWNRVMAVNVTGIFLAVRELGPSMISKGGGSIINVSSIYGIVGPDQRIYEGSFKQSAGGGINTPLVYSASKGAVVAITRYLASCWGKHGVRANALIPGGVKQDQNEQFQRKYGERVPMGRMAEPEELVGAAVFLASDASSYVNGLNLVVDGGLTAW